MPKRKAKLPGLYALNQKAGPFLSKKDKLKNKHIEDVCGLCNSYEDDCECNIDANQDDSVDGGG